MSNYTLWRTMQPGFMRPALLTLPSLGLNLRTNKPVAWDGTFNMPILPLADGTHRDSKHYSICS